MTSLKWLDLPPLWLLAHLLALWALRPLDALALGGWARLPGALLFGAGLLLMLVAVIEMTRARTTVIPHLEPDALVTSGVFRFTRNPIYLGDAMVLAGAALWSGTGLGLLLVPLFMAIIARRFIGPEEARLRRHFGAAFEDWAATTRRWV